MTNKKGFTLIELLVVIVIIGILATAGIAAFNTAQENARDGMRESDRGQIKAALQTVTINAPDWDTAIGDIDGTAGFAVGDVTAFLTKEFPDGLPGDPDGSSAYHVCLEDGTTNAVITSTSERDALGFGQTTLNSPSAPAASNACPASGTWLDVTL